MCNANHSYLTSSINTLHHLSEWHSPVLHAERVGLLHRTLVGHQIKSEVVEIHLLALLPLLLLDLQDHLLALVRHNRQRGLEPVPDLLQRQALLPQPEFGELALVLRRPQHQGLQRGDGDILFEGGGVAMDTVQDQLDGAGLAGVGDCDVGPAIGNQFGWLLVLTFGYELNSVGLHAHRDLRLRQR